jgi:hypothetical protein
VVVGKGVWSRLALAGKKKKIRKTPTNQINSSHIYTCIFVHGHTLRQVKPSGALDIELIIFFRFLHREDGGGEMGRVHICKYF